jgi:glycosyltransferase involved in cell wall biosynthesis
MNVQKTPIKSHYNGTSTEFNLLEIQEPVRWMGPFLNYSGFAGEMLNFLIPLLDRVNVGATHLNPAYYSKNYHRELPCDFRYEVDQLLSRYNELNGGITIAHGPGDTVLGLPKDSEFRVLRTMFETDRIAPLWVELIKSVDEVWVPSNFNVETFHRSGVPLEKLKVVPGAVDPILFDPSKAEPLALPSRASYNFLSIFEWQERKAWDVLLGAYLREFTIDDDVCLWLRCSKAAHLVSRLGNKEASLEEQIEAFAKEQGLSLSRLPRIEVLSNPLPLTSMPSLYRAMDCLIGVSRGEGWGRPQHEAMMMELPVIASNWSGNTEFMSQTNSLLVDCEIIPVQQVENEMAFMAGHYWAQPSEEHTREYMRGLFDDPSQGRQLGQVARKEMQEGFSPEPVSKIVMERLHNAQDQVDARRMTPGWRQPSVPRVRWEGSFLDYGSLSHVNRNLVEALQSKHSEDFEWSLNQSAIQGAINTPDTLRDWESRMSADIESISTDVTVRHGWPPSWMRPVTGGKFVTIQPWEFGFLPESWVKGLEQVDEAWVPSSYVKSAYEASGVPADKVVVIPNGIDETKFYPEAPPLPLKTNKRFKFLFVGGTIGRKGPDVLLNAFAQTFSGDDNVCLVIKDFGGKTFYNGQTLGQTIHELQSRPNAPEIVYLNSELSSEEMIGLYTACDCLVHPYRGEGFGLPVLEAMACGLPVICTGGGSTDDFATDEVAYRLKSESFEFGDEVNGEPLVSKGWLLEPCIKDLIHRLQWVVDHQDEAQALGRKASRYAHECWSWKAAAEKAEIRLKHLADQARRERLVENQSIEPTETRQAASVKSLELAIGISEQGESAIKYAINAADWAVYLQPDDSQALKYHAWLNVQAEGWEAARESYDRLFELGQPQLEDLLPAAMCEYKAGNSLRAIEHWRRVLVLDPDNEPARNNLLSLGEPIAEPSRFLDKIQRAAAVL